MNQAKLILLIGLGMAFGMGGVAQVSTNAPAARSTLLRRATNQFIGPTLPSNRPPPYRPGPAPMSVAKPPLGATPNLPAALNPPLATPSAVTTPVPMRGAITNVPSIAAVTNPPAVAPAAATPAVPTTTAVVPVPAPAANLPPPSVIPAATPSEVPPPAVIANPPRTAPTVAAPAPVQPRATPPPGPSPGPGVPAAQPGATPAFMPAPATPAGPTTAEPEPPPEPRDVDINLPNAPLENILKVYADLTGRTILRPAMLPANQTITLVSNGKLSRTEAIQALHSVLTLNGISMINEGERFVKAVPAQQALQEGAAFSKKNPQDLPEAGEFVTQVVTLTNALPSEVVPTLTPFAKLPAGIVPIDSSMTLVLRDYAPNIKRMMEIIAKVDVVPEMDYKLEVIPIKYGKVEDIYNVMSGLVGGGGGAASTRAATGASSQRSRGASTRRSTTSRGTTGRPGQLGQMGQTQTGQPGQASSFQQRLAQIVNRAATGGEVQLLQDAKIIPDDRANTLVVYAGKQDMAVITNLVAKLDVMLAQVLVEAAIIDVSLNKNLSLGVSMLQNSKTSGNWTGAGGVNNGPQYLSAIGTNNLGQILPSGLTYFMNFSGDLEMAVQALASSGTVTVLQKPRIQTTHAVPASFFNGRTVPYITSSYYGGVGYGNSSQYQQLEVGIGLDVTPYITPDGLVLMEVVQTIDEIAGTTKIDNNDVPITTSRTASSTVSVRDGETIFLGGFIRSSKEKNRSGVPGLKDIPLLGALFRSSSTKSDRSELVVLLRPSVLLTPEDAARTLQAEKQQLPGVRLAEREFKDQEEMVQRAAERELRQKDEAAKKGKKSRNR